MNTQKQIEAVAELDGIDLNEWLPENRKHFNKHYMDSYDSIIPVIQKQPYGVRDLVSDILNTTHKCRIGWSFSTPAQLCEALLRATGKWIE